ncbi:MAG: pyridoxal-dependent decarboxylase [Nitrospirae bacterium]|nr:MAG: pyridoxal-dependent decarboxylase [Nitrospirota bacterium]
MALRPPYSSADLEAALAVVVPRLRALLAEPGRVTTPLPMEALAERFAGLLPEEGVGWEAVAARLDADFLPHCLRMHHPGYAGHQVAVPLPAAAVVDALVGLLNQMASLSDMAPSGALVERQVVRSLAARVGFDPAACDGVCTSGGSVSNLIAVLAARNRAFPELWEAGPSGAAPRAFCSEDVHYSVTRAFGVAGLGTRALVPVATDAAGRMRPEALEAAIAEARASGATPFLVVAGAPSTPVGAFDPIRAIAALCRREGLWLHVDAAHGGGLLFSPRLRRLLDGVELADSVSLDGHKMIYQPSSQGWILFRRGADAYAAFRQRVPYLLGPDGEERGYDAIGKSLQCTRRLDALKLWVSWHLYGARRFGAWAEACVAAARSFHRLLADHPHFEPVHEPACNIVCFRARHPSGRHVDPFHDAIRARLLEEGRAWVVLTTWRGERLLRTAWMNPTQGEAEAAAVLEALDAARAAVLAA